MSKILYLQVQGIQAVQNFKYIKELKIIKFQVWKIEMIQLLLPNLNFKQNLQSFRFSSPIFDCKSK